MQAKPYLKLFVLCVLNQEKSVSHWLRKKVLHDFQVQQCFFDIFQPLKTAVKKEEHIFLTNYISVYLVQYREVDTLVRQREPFWNEVRKMQGFQWHPPIKTNITSSRICNTWVPLHLLATGFRLEDCAFYFVLSRLFTFLLLAVKGWVTIHLWTLPISTVSTTKSKNMRGAFGFLAFPSLTLIRGYYIVGVQKKKISGG